MSPAPRARLKASNRGSGIHKVGQAFRTRKDREIVEMDLPTSSLNRTRYFLFVGKTDQQDLS